MTTTTICNTMLHQRTGLIVNPFGTDGAAHLTLLQGERESHPFILDALAVRELINALSVIEEDGLS